MVGPGSAGDAARAKEISGGPDAKERRGIDRCRRALEKGRRVRGRTIASDERHGLLLDLRGAVGHVPAADAAARAVRGARWRGDDAQWEGWVVAITGDLVHLGARRPREEHDEAPLRTAHVVGTARPGVMARLEDGSTAIVPWDELSWEPMLAPPELPAGTPLRGRVVALTLEGPVLSPRAVAPSPWPAIALALPPGTDVTVRLEARERGHALVRTEQAPRAAVLVPDDALPTALGPGAIFAATVERVNAIAASLVLENLRPRSRAPRHAPAAGRPGPRGPGQAASGSRS